MFLIGIAASGCGLVFYSESVCCQSDTYLRSDTPGFVANSDTDKNFIAENLLVFMTVKILKLSVIGNVALEKVDTEPFPCIEPPPKHLDPHLTP